MDNTTQPNYITSFEGKQVAIETPSGKYEGFVKEVTNENDFVLHGAVYNEGRYVGKTLITEPESVRCVNPRYVIEEVNVDDLELISYAAESINPIVSQQKSRKFRKQGTVDQPPIVNKKDKKYIVITNHQQVKWAIQAGLEKIPALTTIISDYEATQTFIDHHIPISEGESGSVQWYSDEKIIESVNKLYQDWGDKIVQFDAVRNWLQQNSVALPPPEKDVFLSNRELFTDSTEEPDTVDDETSNMDTSEQESEKDTATQTPTPIPLPAVKEQPDKTDTHSEDEEQEETETKEEPPVSESNDEPNDLTSDDKEDESDEIDEGDEESTKKNQTTKTETEPEEVPPVEIPDLSLIIDDVPLQQNIETTNKNKDENVIEQKTSPIDEVFYLVAQLENQSKKGAPAESVVQQAKKQGIQRQEVYKHLKKLRKENRIHKPYPAHFRPLKR